MNKNLILPPLFTSLLFTGSYIAGKYAIVDLGPISASLWRYVVALVFLSGLLFHFKTESLKVEGNDLGFLILSGLFGIVGYHYFFFSALRYTQVANTAIINAFSPIITGIMAAVFIGERLTRQNYIGVAMAFSGVIILLTRGRLENILLLKVNIGDLLMLCSVLSWGIYALLIKRMVRKYTEFTITFYATLFGVIFLIGLSGLENQGNPALDMSMVSLGSILYMGLCASGVGYLLYNMSIRRIGPTKTSSMVYSLVPGFVAILARIVFNEPITGVMILSMGLILLGLQFTLKEQRSSDKG